MVPNKHPSLPFNGLAIVGEAPGKHEEILGEPFVGPSGRLLKGYLSRVGINPSACYYGNVAQERPPGNDISRFSWDGHEITEGLAILNEDISRLKPALCLLLGNVAFKAAMDADRSHALKPGKFRYPVSSWRGTLLRGASNSFVDLRCISSYHPAAILRQFKWAPILHFDLKKAARVLPLDGIPQTQRTIISNPDYFELCSYMEKIIREKPKISIDIEGGVGTMSCISIATSPTEVFIVPLARVNGTSYWENPQMEARIWRLLAAILEDPDIHKILQNALYDRFVLQYSYGIVVRGVHEDTMLKHWEAYCELEKNLGFQASIYTDEPYYKFERKIDDQNIFYEYCCKDSAITYEISNKLDPQLHGPARTHYQFNVSMLNPLLYMELRGIRYNHKLARTRRKELQLKMFEHIHTMNVAAGRSCTEMSLDELKRIMRELMCYKRDGITPKKSFEKDYNNLVVGGLLTEDRTIPHIAGEIETILQIGLNVNSTKFTDFLYRELRLPIQLSKDGKPSADYPSLLNLRDRLKEDTKERTIIDHAIEVRSLDTRSSLLAIRADPDGRVRCGYNIVGSKTGRLTCYTSPTGSGYNLQTIPKEDRDLYEADPLMHFFNIDLSGADGWTVAAHAKNLGDPTMYDDLVAGIKPAKILCLALQRGATIMRYAREDLAELTRDVTSDDPDYAIAKMGQHGSCYLMGDRTLVNYVYKKSEGRIRLSINVARDLQRLFFIRYHGIKSWHRWTKACLAKKPVLTSASGHSRIFFGRPEEILTNALADEPQNNTTYATNLAAYRLWHDPDNRKEGSNKLIIEPLHQVHDALNGQFPQNRTEWSLDKLRSYFQNELIIAGQKITIPFEGSYGPSWGKQPFTI